MEEKDYENPVILTLHDVDDDDEEPVFKDPSLSPIICPMDDPGEPDNPMDIIDNSEPEKDPNIVPTFATVQGGGRRSLRTKTRTFLRDQDQFARVCQQQMLRAQADALGPKTPKGFMQASKGKEGKKWMTSMGNEYETHVKNGTFGDLVPRATAEARRKTTHKKYFYIVNGLWKYRVKTKNGVVEKLKSRFCADGSTQEADDEETFSPTARMATIRTLMALAAEMGADVRNGDVPGAYLNADIDDDTEIYITQPKGFEVSGKEDWVYKLNKALYGLKQAGKLWNSLLHSFLLEIGFKQNIADPCLYYKRSEKNREKSEKKSKSTNVSTSMLVVAITVDDFLYFGTEQKMIDDFITSLEDRFDYIDEGLAEWFLGMKVEQDYDSIRLSQEDYINSITKQWPKVYKTNLPAKPGVILEPTLAPKNRNFPYRKLCGQLRYATLTRPDIEFPLNQCCKYQECWDDSHITALRKIVGYLKKYPRKPLVFRKRNLPTSDLIIMLTGLADSSFADQPRRLSSYGYMVRLNNHSVAWKGRTTPNVATSSSAAEYVAIAECLKELIHTKQVLEGMEFVVEVPMIFLTDSTGAIGIAKFKRIHDRSKHIDVRYHFTRERVMDGSLKLMKVSTDENSADIFTKPLCVVKLNKFTDDILCPT